MKATLKLLVLGALAACNGHGAASIDPPDAASASATPDAAVGVPSDSGSGSHAAAQCTATAGHPALVDIETGGPSACALYADGHIACWGLATWGELGDGLTSHATCAADECSLAPVRVSGISDAIAISLGADDACALHADGTVSCWGDDTDGEVGDGAHTHTTCVGTDCAFAPVTVGGLTDAIAISVGDVTACALRRGGGVVCWGSNEQGQLGDGVAAHEMCGTLPDEAFDCSHLPVAVAGLADAVEVSVGDAEVCARRATGGVVCWGDGLNGQLGDGALDSMTTPVAVTGLSDAIAVRGGFDAACALHAGGGVSCWGWDGNGMLGDGIVAHHKCVGATDCSPTPVAVTGLADAVALTGSWGHACAVRANGAVACWGDNSTFELGDGQAHTQCSGTCSKTPVVAAGLTSPAAVRANAFVTCALAQDCSVACWGLNSTGGLGDGTTSDRKTPTAVVGL